MKQCKLTYTTANGAYRGAGGEARNHHLISITLKKARKSLFLLTFMHKRGIYQIAELTITS